MKLVLITIIFFLVFWWFPRGKYTQKVIYLKRFSVSIFGILLILGLILFSTSSLEAAKKGGQLFLNIVFPSLFPFFVGAEVLYKTGVVRILGVLLEPIMRPLFNVPGCGSFPFLMGITSGYPVGAKITVALRQEKLLSQKEGERLLAFTNNSGPLFIIGAVSVGMYSMPSLGLFLFICHFAACVTVGILFRFYGKHKESSKNQKNKSVLKHFVVEWNKSFQNPALNLGSILGEAVKNSIFTLLSVGGFIIFFSVLIRLFNDAGWIGFLSKAFYVFLSPWGISPDLLPPLISGFFEITTGVSMVSKVYSVPFYLQLVATSILIGWAGLSVHAQVFSILSTSDLSFKPYLLGKFLQSIISGLYTFLSIKIAGPSFLGARPAWIINSDSHGVMPPNIFLLCLLAILICISIMFLLSRILSLCRL